MTCELTLALSGVPSLGSDPGSANIVSGLAHACEPMGLRSLGTSAGRWLRVAPEA